MSASVTPLVAIAIAAAETTTLDGVEIVAGGATGAARRRRRLLVAVGTSGVLHAITVVALGLLVAVRPEPPIVEHLESSVAAIEPAIVEQLADFAPPDPQTTATFEPTRVATNVSLSPVVGAPRSVAAVKSSPPAPSVALDVRASPNLLAGLEPGKFKVGLGQIRTPAQRMQAVLYRGGTTESEQAVAAALAWLARHQNADGGWSFDHRACGDCGGRCRSPGTLARAQVAATSLALLPFLAAGQTHKQGAYKKQIDAGLKFIVRNMQPTTHGGAFTQGGGTMYAQALATITLCEALSMTRDKDLIAPAQAAARYIVNTQDPQGGGWRYFPGMPGDTSVTGWQLMALRSADNAYIPVPALTIEKMRHFFDSMQRDEGAAYGYLAPDVPSTASTPVGLLSRMTLGWKRSEPALVRGVATLSAAGPNPDNIYYDFYATQVMHHYGGPLWDKWNTAMRDGLVRTQLKEGHEAGSWFMVEASLEDQQSSLLGGRLYVTAMAALTLEVYYRHLPLYGNRIWMDRDE